MNYPDQKQCKPNNGGRKFIITCSDAGTIWQADCLDGDCHKTAEPYDTGRPCDGIEKECDCQCE